MHTHRLWCWPKMMVKISQHACTNGGWPAVDLGSEFQCLKPAQHGEGGICLLTNSCTFPRDIQEKCYQVTGPQSLVSGPWSPVHCLWPQRNAHQEDRVQQWVLSMQHAQCVPLTRLTVVLYSFFRFLFSILLLLKNFQWSIFRFTDPIFCFNLSVVGCL